MQEEEQHEAVWDGAAVVVASEVVVVASVVVAVHAEHLVAVVDSAVGAEEASPEEEEGVVLHEEVEAEASAAQGEGEGTRDILVSRTHKAASSPPPPLVSFRPRSESLLTFTLYSLVSQCHRRVQRIDQSDQAHRQPGLGKSLSISGDGLGRLFE